MAADADVPMQHVTQEEALAALQEKGTPAESCS